jgi:hypothetical protein
MKAVLCLMMSPLPPVLSTFFLICVKFDIRGLHIILTCELHKNQRSEGCTFHTGVNSMPVRVYRKSVRLLEVKDAYVQCVYCSLSRSTLFATLYAFSIPYVLIL